MTHEPTAETLYDLCEQVAQAIETKPGNYYQGSYHRSVETCSDFFGGVYTEACGTAYCRAGWMVVLAEPVGIKHDNSGFLYEKANHLLRTVAGISPYEVNDLFGAMANGLSKPGSSNYATRGARGMREFTERHKDKLQAINLKDHLNADGTIRHPGNDDTVTR